MASEEPTRQNGGSNRFGQRKDPRLEGLISGWKKGEKDKWRGHGKKDGKKKR
ncbi:MAG: hypothetical protein PHP28_12825 [Actinomycetota bacterium]|nr:hypothetical protein [Actinomycetota bacterium]MDD5666828.1 hypothetical protein [Actinomycetota bacterium]